MKFKTTLAILAISILTVILTGCAQLKNLDLAKLTGQNQAPKQPTAQHAKYELTPASMASWKPVRYKGTGTSKCHADKYQISAMHTGMQFEITAKLKGTKKFHKTFQYKKGKSKRFPHQWKNGENYTFLGTKNKGFIFAGEFRDADSCVVAFSATRSYGDVANLQ